MERFYPEVLKFDDLTERATHRSPWPVSRFLLICDTDADIELSVTARLPATSQLETDTKQQERVTLTVNNESAGSISLGTKWSSQSLHVDRGLLTKGINTIGLRWPLPAIPGHEALEAAIQQLELGWEADLHPVFGEIYSLVAKPIAK